MPDPESPPSPAQLQAHRVRVEGVDWASLLPVIRLFAAFRMAIHPAKLLLALMLVIVLYLGGLALDTVWGVQVYPGEVSRYIERPSDQYDAWLALQRRHLGQARELGRDDPRIGIFDTLLSAEIEAFRRLIVSASSFDFGLRALASSQPSAAGGVIGALFLMVVGIPGWLVRTHPGFTAVYCGFAFLLTAWVGGAICRLAALHACANRRPSAFTALHFAGRKYIWFVLAPLIPVVLALFVGLLLALVGLALFNLPILDVIGAALFGVLLLGGFVMALLLVGFAGASNLLWPAVAVEGSDAFDAISRAFNYVYGRPWRYLFYSAAALVYGAITYLFFGFVVYLVLLLTKASVGAWVFAEMAEGGPNRFDAVLPDTELGQLMPAADWDGLDRSGKVSAALVNVWVKLLISFLPAFALSYYFCAQTWIYLLLRQSADGAETSYVNESE